MIALALALGLGIMIGASIAFVLAGTIACGRRADDSLPPH
jgi:hypothetical protein